MKKLKDEYDEYTKDIIEKKKQVIPFESMQLKYSIEMKDNSFNSALIQ